MAPDYYIWQNNRVETDKTACPDHNPITLHTQTHTDSYRIFNILKRMLDIHNCTTPGYRHTVLNFYRRTTHNMNILLDIYVASD